MKEIVGKKGVTYPHLVGDVGKLYYKAYYEEQAPSETVEQWMDRKKEAKESLDRYKKPLEIFDPESPQWSYQRDLLTIASHLGEVRWDERKKKNERLEDLEEERKKEMENVISSWYKALKHVFTSLFPAGAAWIASKLGLSAFGVESEELSYAVGIASFAYFAKRTDDKQREEWLKIDEKYDDREKSIKGQYDEKMRREYRSAESEVYAEYELMFGKKPEIPPTSDKLYHDGEKAKRWKRNVKV